MEIADLLQSCIENFNINIDELRDLGLAICFSDKFNGTNHIELDIDKFVVSDDESWGRVLDILGINGSVNGDALPRVQKLRVVSDMLTISLSHEIPNLVLTNKSSVKVSKLKGLNLDCIDYADEFQCIANLEAIQSYINDMFIDVDEELESLLIMLDNYHPDVSKCNIVLPRGYMTTDYRKKNFVECSIDKFNKREFIRSINIYCFEILMGLEDYRWISAFNIFDSCAKHIGGRNSICCINADINRRLSKCTRLRNGVDLFSKISYSVYDCVCPKILLISLFANKIVDDLNRYI